MIEQVFIVMYFIQSIRKRILTIFTMLNNVKLGNFLSQVSLRKNCSHARRKHLCNNNGHPFINVITKQPLKNSNVYESISKKEDQAETKMLICPNPIVFNVNAVPSNISQTY